jgi:hypothetical protein
MVNAERTICATQQPELAPGVHHAACHFSGELRAAGLEDPR